MAIDITVAISRREKEIAALRELRDELLYLIADADRVAWGKEPHLTAPEFQRRLSTAEDEANRLGVALPYAPVDTWVVK